MKCAPKIWKKFNKAEQKLWDRLYKQFVWKEIWANGMATTKEQREITAHNMACTAVWELQELFKSKGLQKIKKPAGYKFKMDDHCLQVNVKQNTIWLSQEVCAWIMNNYEKIDFENNKFLN